MFWRIENVCYLEQIPAEQPCAPARPLEFLLCLHLLEGSLFCNGGTDFALCGRSCFPWHSQDDLVIPLIKCVSREKLCDRQGDPVRLAKCWWRFCLGQAAGGEVLEGAGHGGRGGVSWIQLWGVKRSALALDYWNCVHLCAHEFGDMSMHICLLDICVLIQWLRPAGYPQQSQSIGPFCHPSLFSLLQMVQARLKHEEAFQEGSHHCFFLDTVK